jgi:hypothetical protein
MAWVEATGICIGSERAAEALGECPFTLISSSLLTTFLSSSCSFVGECASGCWDGRALLGEGEMVPGHITALVFTVGR